jgi:hypothetical protein
MGWHVLTVSFEEAGGACIEHIPASPAMSDPLVFGAE